MSYILRYVWVALATSDVQSILEILATYEILMEDQNHGLAWTKLNNGTVNRHMRKQLDLNHVVPEQQ